MTPTRALDRILTTAALLCPLFLTHGRGLAEACIDIAAIAFLLRSAFVRDWDWLTRPWLVVAAIWWGWLSLCSVPFGPFGAGGWPDLIQALATLRFLLFVAALEHVALRDPGARRAMRWLLAACCLYIAAQLLLQDLTGHNLFGNPRFHDGTLTGPYDKPRAAAPLSRLLLPVMLVASASLRARLEDPVPQQIGVQRPPAFGGFGQSPTFLARSGIARARLALPILPLLAGLALIVLAGQRMPMLLTLLGLLVAGLFLRRLRLPLLLALILAPVLIALSALVSPHSFAHLVLLFGRQMDHFGRSPYGLIYTRAVSIAVSNPLTGLGFDGFRNGCPDPAYFRSWPPWSYAPGDGGGAAICVQHAHNHLLQAVTDSGIPGLLLFVAMVLAWLVSLAPGLLRPRPGTSPALHAWRVGLFAAVFIQEWPIASASAFTNMPLGGWFFLLLGVGLADAYIERRHDHFRSGTRNV